MKLRWWRFKRWLWTRPGLRVVAGGCGIGQERADWKWAGKVRCRLSWATGLDRWFMSSEVCRICGARADDVEYSFERGRPFGKPRCVEDFHCEDAA